LDSTAVANDGATTVTTTSITAISASSLLLGGGANNEVADETTSMDDEFESMSSSGRTYTHPTPQEQQLTVVIAPPLFLMANKFDFLAKGVIPCVFFSALFWAKLRGKKVTRQ